MGMTWADLAWKLYSSAPITALVLCAVLYLVTLVIIKVLDYLARRGDPEAQFREQLRAFATEANQHRARVAADLLESERRTGRMLILTRELETALHRCMRICPGCAGEVDAAYERARAQSTRSGLGWDQSLDKVAGYTA